MNNIENEIQRLLDSIECIKSQELIINEAILILKEFNFIFGHIRTSSSSLTFWCDVSVGKPVQGMVSVLKKLAANGFHQLHEGGKISPIQTGLDWKVYKGKTIIIITALVEGTTCEIVQVSTEERPIYAVKCA